MDISYEYDVQDVLINSRKARPEPEPNWRSLYEDLKNKYKDLEANYSELTIINSKVIKAYADKCIELDSLKNKNEELNWMYADLCR